MTPGNRRFSASLILTTGLLALASPAAWAACSVTTPPEGWAATSLRWDGDCSNGLATGLGVLKEQQGTTVQRSFFGRVENGELALGVIDTPEQGFSAGHFAQGRVQASDERQVYIDAFNVAAQAAGAAATRFEQAGNNASAQFYRQKEQAFHEQLD